MGIGNDAINVNSLKAYQPQVLQTVETISTQVSQPEFINFSSRTEQPVVISSTQSNPIAAAPVIQTIQAPVVATPVQIQPQAVTVVPQQQARPAFGRLTVPGLTSTIYQNGPWKGLPTLESLAGLTDDTYGNLDAFDTAQGIATAPIALPMEAAPCAVQPAPVAAVPVTVIPAQTVPMTTIPAQAAPLVLQSAPVQSAPVASAPVQAPVQQAVPQNNEPTNAQKAIINKISQQMGDKVEFVKEQNNPNIIARDKETKEEFLIDPNGKIYGSIDTTPKTEEKAETSEVPAKTEAPKTEIPKEAAPKTEPKIETKAEEKCEQPKITEAQKIRIKQIEEEDGAVNFEPDPNNPGRLTSKIILRTNDTSMERNRVVLPDGTSASITKIGATLRNYVDRYSVLITRPNGEQERFEAKNQEEVDKFIFKSLNNDINKFSV